MLIVMCLVSMKKIFLFDVHHLMLFYNFDLSIPHSISNALDKSERRSAKLDYQFIVIAKLDNLDIDEKREHEED